MRFVVPEVYISEDNEPHVDIAVYDFNQLAGRRAHSLDQEKQEGSVASTYTTCQHVFQDVVETRLVYQKTLVDVNHIGPKLTAVMTSEDSLVFVCVSEFCCQPCLRY